MAILIAYYSRAGENYFGGAYRRIPVGNTEKAAQMLASLTGGELFKIEQARPYSENYQVCIAEAKADLQKKARPEVLHMPENLDACDEVYLGYPNYWGTMPMAVYTFLEAYDFTGKTIHPFCTMREAALRVQYGIFRELPGALWSQRDLPSTEARWTAQNRQLKNGPGRIKRDSRLPGSCLGGSPFCKVMRITFDFFTVHR